jgi:hypothetical protein
MAAWSGLQRAVIDEHVTTVKLTQELEDIQINTEENLMVLTG